MKKLTSVHEKFIIFTDIHYGNDKDSELFLDENDKVINWIIDTCSKRNITAVIFGGDYFHKRDSVDTRTQNRGYDAIKKLVNAGLTVYFIIGNHDIYMKDSVEINSVKSFQDIKGLELIDDLTELNVNDKRKLLLVPWLGAPSTASQKYDCIIGHIPINDVEMTEGGGDYSLETKGYTMTDMFKISPIVFIGHYHIKKDYKFSTGLVRSLGCPLQQTWGDVGLPKGIWYFDAAGMKTEFIENTFSPKHMEILYSKYVEKSIDKNDFTGNYVRPVFDLPFEQSDAYKFLDYVNDCKPSKIEASKFLYTVKFKSTLTESVGELSEGECEKLMNMPLTEACMKWVETHLPKDKNLDMEKLRSILINCYNMIMEKRKKQEKEEQVS